MLMVMVMLRRRNERAFVLHLKFISYFAFSYGVSFFFLQSLVASYADYQSHLDFNLSFN